MLTSNTLNVWRSNYVANEHGANSERRVFLKVKGVGVIVNQMQTCTPTAGGENRFENEITARFFTPMTPLTRQDVMVALIAHDTRESSVSRGEKLKAILCKYLTQFNSGMMQLENGLPQPYTQTDVDRVADIAITAYKDIITNINGLFECEFISRGQLLQLLKEAEIVKKSSLEALARQSGRAACDDVSANMNGILSSIDYDVLVPAGFSLQEILSVTDD